MKKKEKAAASYKSQVDELKSKELEMINSFD